MKLWPGVERTMIGDISAAVVTNANGITLMWMDKFGRQVTLTGNKELQLVELVKIAASVTSPPSQVLESSLKPVGDLLVLRGQSQRHHGPSSK